MTALLKRVRVAPSTIRWSAPQLTPMTASRTTAPSAEKRGSSCKARTTQLHKSTRSRTLDQVFIQSRAANVYHPGIRTLISERDVTFRTQRLRPPLPSMVRPFKPPCEAADCQLAIRVTLCCFGIIASRLSAAKGDSIFRQTVCNPA